MRCGVRASRCRSCGHRRMSCFLEASHDPSPFRRPPLCVLCSCLDRRAADRLRRARSRRRYVRAGGCAAGGSCRLRRDALACAEGGAMSAKLYLLTERLIAWAALLGTVAFLVGAVVSFVGVS